MRFVRGVLISLLVLFVATTFFVVFNQKHLKEMQQVAHNVSSAVFFEIKDAETAVNYLHLSATQVMNNKEKFDFEQTFKKSYQDERYTYSLYEADAKYTQFLDKANLLGYSDRADDRRYTDEQAAALFLSDNMKLVAKQNTSFAWVYYFSKHHFTVIYPYISADDFAFDMNMEKEPFFACATPELNPQKKLFFTPLYTDLIGKGLMVTLGKPVYVKGEFLGTVDIDITLNHIDNILFNLDTLKNKSLLYNDKMQILGSHNIIRDFNRSKIYNATEYVPQTLLDTEDTDGEVLYGNGYYFYTKKILNTPFTLIYFQKAMWIWLKNLAFLFPVLILFVLLLIILNLYVKSRKVMSALEEQATKDYLSGAYNRRYFFDIGSAIFLKAQRKNAAVAVVMLDIDDFKKVNDVYGHKAGDKGIIYIKKVLEANLRKSDLFARFGGEEFCILLDDISLKDVSMLLEKIRKEFEVSVLRDSNNQFSFTVSFGVAYGMMDSLEEMINLADKALYKAKSKGKNNVTIYETHQGSV